MEGAKMEKYIETIEKRWDTNAGKYDDSHGTGKNIEEWSAAIKRLLGDNLSKTVLDVGTGTGFISLIEAELGYPCTGLDLSEGMMGCARKHAEERGVALKYVKSCVEETPFEDNNYDIVTNRSLMWTLTDPQRALTEWKRILKPEGKLFCFCHISLKKSEHNHYDQEIEDSLPLKGAPAKDYEQALVQAGFLEVQAIPLMELPAMHDTEKNENNCWYVFTGKK
jgi:ubiquinone/menaquinone biosynthesis C-methylase UbiE